ncbi:MAG: 4-hydroxy-tetrahydrodipicolinate synthase [Candidatus Omnitrophica bacterium CG1_02_49_10]|nr:MAG: 4-hydroxy-tetrahydrodipicolinate synthase [Candidatus Omnitrophica bacterium CG1_02_49_10]
MFEGSYVAIITPFAGSKVDEKKYAELIEFQIENGIDGIVPCGCTGEAATLSHEEQNRTIAFASEVVRKRVKVVAGTGSNNTEEAITLTRYAKESGADGALLITPYYNKPTPEGQFRHYEKIAKEVDIPIMLYNVPSRTGISMLPETVARLSKISNIVAIKEASGSLDQVSAILAQCDIEVLSGDDSLTLPMMALGAKGVVSVIANVVPKDVADMVNAYLEGDIEKAKSLHFKLLPICKAMFIETNPIPVKTAMKLMGRSNGRFRLPLCEMSDSNVPKLKDALKEYGLI